MQTAVFFLPTRGCPVPRGAGPPARVHADRAVGGDRDHRDPDRPAAARRPEGPRGRRPDQVRQQPPPTRARLPQPPRRHRPLPHGGLGLGLGRRPRPRLRQGPARRLDLQHDGVSPSRTTPTSWARGLPFNSSGPLAAHRPAVLDAAAHLQLPQPAGGRAVPEHGLGDAVPVPGNRVRDLRERAYHPADGPVPTTSPAKGTSGPPRSTAARPSGPPPTPTPSRTASGTYNWFPSHHGRTDFTRADGRYGPTGVMYRRSETPHDRPRPEGHEQPVHDRREIPAHRQVHPGRLSGVFRRRGQREHVHRPQQRRRPGDVLLPAQDHGPPFRFPDAAQKGNNETFRFGSAHPSRVQHDDGGRFGPPHQYSIDPNLFRQGGNRFSTAVGSFTGN